MATLDETFSLLRDLNEPVPKSGKLPTAEQVDDVEQATGSAFPKDLIRYFLEVSDVVVGTLEPVTLDDPKSHTYYPNVLGDARAAGVPRELVPICENNGDYFCMTGNGVIVYWNHSGTTDDKWNSL